MIPISICQTADFFGKGFAPIWTLTAPLRKRTTLFVHGNRRYLPKLWLTLTACTFVVCFRWASAQNLSFHRTQRKIWQQTREEKKNAQTEKRVYFRPEALPLHLSANFDWHFSGPTRSLMAGRTIWVVVFLGVSRKFCSLQWVTDGKETSV